MTERTFKRRRGGLVNLLFLEIDDQHTRELRSAVSKGRFDVAEQAIARQIDCNERFHFIEAAADWDQDAPFLREWAASGSQVGRMAVGIHTLKRSWDHATWMRGPNDMPRFKAMVAFATRELGAVAKASPREATPFYWLIWAAYATGQGRRAQQLYEEGVRRAPTLMPTHSVGVRTATTPFGSQHASLDLARQIARDMPPGQGGDMLIIEAHWNLSDFKKDEYWQRPEVQDEVLAADE